MIVVGFLMFDWAGYDMFLPDPAPYRYEQIAEGTIADFPDLGLAAPPDLAIRKLEIRAEDGGDTLAELYVADPGEGAPPVLLDWRNRASATALGLANRSENLDRLARAVTQHVPADAIMLAWWDTSRQLKALTGVDIRYDDNLPRPLLVPPAWRDRRASIEAIEGLFWRISENAAADFAPFLDALVDQPEAGAARLAEIAGGRRAFVAVQLADTYKLALARPDRFGAGIRDFRRGGDLHDEIQQVKEWLDAEGLAAYAVAPIGIAMNRVYYLTDSATAETLLAHMLPFGAFDPRAIKGLKLVASYGSYWVYEIAPGSPTSE